MNTFPLVRDMTAEIELLVAEKRRVEYGIQVNIIRVRLKGQCHEHVLQLSYLFYFRRNLLQYLHVSKSSVEKLRFLKFSQCTGKNQNTILPYFAHSREPTAESIYDRACRSISRAAAVELVKK